MNKAKKMLVVYLISSSVVLHLMAACALYEFGPLVKSYYEIRPELARAWNDASTNTTVAKDVSTLRDGDHAYTGLAVDYDGQTLYVMGDGTDKIDAGDEVMLTMTRLQFGPSTPMMIMATKLGP